MWVVGTTYSVRLLKRGDVVNTPPTKFRRFRKDLPDGGIGTDFGGSRLGTRKKFEEAMFVFSSLTVNLFLKIPFRVDERVTLCDGTDELLVRRDSTSKDASKRLLTRWAVARLAYKRERERDENWVRQRERNQNLLTCLWSWVVDPVVANLST